MIFSDFVQINPKVKLKRKSKYEYVSMEDITPRKRYVRSKEKKKYSGSHSKFKSGDVLFARITPCLENGKIAQYISTEDTYGFGSTEFIVFRNKEGVSLQDFVYYICLSNIIRKPAEKSMFGASGRQRVNISVLNNIEIPNYSLYQQEKIIEILGALDDLVDVNEKRIQVLEQMSRTLYHEWFVNLKFPGYKNTGFIETEHGILPKGWEISSASETMYIDPKMKIWKGEKKYVPMASISTTSMIIKEYEKREKISGSKFQNGDTLFARITPSLENGKTGFVQFLDDGEVGIGSTEFIVLRSKTLTPEFVYLMARSERFRSNAIQSMIGASGRQRVQKECFNNFFFPHPSKELLQKFSEKIAPIFKQVHILTQKNKKLNIFRDLLLPKLISSEIDVSDLDINIGG